VYVRKSEWKEEGGIEGEGEEGKKDRKRERERERKKEEREKERKRKRDREDCVHTLYNCPRLIVEFASAAPTCPSNVFRYMCSVR